MRKHILVTVPILQEHDNQTIEVPYSIRIEECELDAVQRAAQLHSIPLEVENFEQEVAVSKTTNRDGLIVSLSKEAEATAIFYAEATGRRFVSANNFDALGQLTNVAVVIVLTSDITPDLMLWVHRESVRTGRSPGLITGRDKAALKLNAAKFALSLKARQTRDLDAVYINPYAPYTSRKKTGLLEIGSGAEAQEVRSTLSAGHPILAIETHADIGANAWLNPDLILCPNKIGPQSSEALRPMCLDTGHCYRFGDYPTRKQAWDEKRLIDPSAVSTQILVFFGCAVLRPADGVLAPTFSVGAAVADEANFGAGLMTWCDAVSAEDGGTVNGIVEDLARCISAGEALGRFHRSDVAKTYGSYLCLIGDPDFQLPEPFNCEPAIGNVNTAIRETKSHGVEYQNIEFIEHVLLAPLYVASATEKQKHLRECLEKASIEPFSPDDWPVVSAGIANLLSTYPWLTKYGADGYVTRAAELREQCPRCVQSARTYVMTHELNDRLSRQYLLCESCGAAWSRSLASQVTVEYEDNGTFHIHGAKGNAIINSVVEARDTRYIVSERWNFAEVTGALQIQLSNAPPEGPGFCHIHVISQDDIAHFAFRCRVINGLLILSNNNGAEHQTHSN